MRLIVLFCALLSGCATVAPDPALVRWADDDAWWSAALHADRISGIALKAADTGSMEPMIVGGDWIVGDFAFRWADIAPGMVLLYDANWRDPDLPLVCHMAVAKSGDGWIMSGLANRYSESGANALMFDDYRARVVAVYTARRKP